MQRVRTYQDASGQHRNAGADQLVHGIGDRAGGPGQHLPDLVRREARAGNFPSSHFPAGNSSSAFPGTRRRYLALFAAISALSLQIREFPSILPGGGHISSRTAAAMATDRPCTLPRRLPSQDPGKVI
jgi:hypothetical protein